MDAPQVGVKEKFRYSLNNYLDADADGFYDVFVVNFPSYLLQYKTGRRSFSDLI